MATARFLLIAALALASAPAAAQAPDRKAGRAPQATPAGPEQPLSNAAPPYEPQLLRLAEILGALHHLRTVCNAPDANVWRDRMSSLIEAEGAAPDRRDRLASAFNAGFRAWARSYRVCTPAATVAVRRFLTEVSTLVADVNARYGQ